MRLWAWNGDRDGRGELGIQSGSFGELGIQSGSFGFLHNDGLDWHMLSPS